MSDPVDISNFTDEELQSLRASIDNETSNRQIRSTLPNQVATLCYSYKSAGGNPSDILNAIQDWISSQTPSA